MVSAYERQRAENAAAWGPIDGIDESPAGMMVWTCVRCFARFEADSLYGGMSLCDECRRVGDWWARRAG